MPKPTTTQTDEMQNLLSPRNVDFLHFCVEHGGFFTAEQAENYYFSKNPSARKKQKNINSNNASKILSRLCAAKYLGLDFMPLRTPEDRRYKQPKKILFFNQRHVKKIIDDLEQERRTDEADLFSGYIESFSEKGKGYQEGILRHERDLSDCIIAIKKHPQSYIMRFSPRNHSTAFSVKIKTILIDPETNKEITKTYSLTPDALLFFPLGDNTYQFHPIEYERDIGKSERKIRDKIRTYVALREHPEIFMNALENILPQYGFEIPLKAKFNPLFITADERTRNRQLVISSQYTFNEHAEQLKDFFYFAHYDDVIKKPLGSIWICQKTVGNKIINEFWKDEKTITHRTVLYKNLKENIDRTKLSAIFPSS